MTLSFIMPLRLTHVTFLVRDYDEALTYFTTKLGFQLIEDRPVSPAKRWLLVAPPGPGQTALLLAKAATPEQLAQVGKQAAGRVAFFLHTDDFPNDYAALKSRGVQFAEEPRHEPYGSVAVFQDLYGNRWDLLGD